MKSKNKKKPSAASASKHRWARRSTLWSFVLFVVLVLTGTWYARHPRTWLESSIVPQPLAHVLLYFGDRTLMLTDALGWTGHDAVYTSDDPAPANTVFFAGAPKRTGVPAPTDIVTLDRGPFVVGWSARKGHPYWVAYHVPVAAKHLLGNRPAFRKDRDVPSSPAANAYNHSGYDRGHLAPNYAIATRFGAEAQNRTFLMSNVAPQTPTLNRGPWRELERRIADFWTRRWGEIWVICGTIPCHTATPKTLRGTHIEVPDQFWMLIVAQEGTDVRAMALVLPQQIKRDAFPVHYLVTIDTLEEMTGLDLLPNLPSYLQNALEADLPTRLWPIRLQDALPLILMRCHE